MNPKGPKSSPTGSQPSPTPPGPPRKRRLNLRAILALGLAALVVAGGLYGVSAMRGANRNAQLLAQAKALRKERRPDLALNYLNAYLQQRGDDLDALDLKAEILAEIAGTPDQINAAAQATDLVLRRRQDAPEGQAVRRRLAKIYLKAEGLVPAREVRYRTAEAVMRDYFAREATREELRAKDPKAAPPTPAKELADAHHLLGRALLGEALLGDKEALGKAPWEPKGSDKAQKTGAFRELEEAARLAPDDPEVAERLALVCIEPRLTPSRPEGAKHAAAVMDRLVGLNKTAEARLAKYRILVALADSRPERLRQARAELDEALRAEPKNLDLLLAAGEQSLALNDLAAARRYLAAIPEEVRRETLAVREFEGRLELRENQPEVAIESWRQGLRLTGGTNADLTFKLAMIQLMMGGDHAEDARPLIAQFRRLVDQKDPPSARLLDALYLLKSTPGPASRRQENREGAIKILEELRLTIATLPKALHPMLYQSLGEAYLARSADPDRLADPDKLAKERATDKAKALEAFRLGAATPQRPAGPRLAIAQVRAQPNTAKALGEAADELRRGLADLPDDPSLLVALAQILWKQQNALPRSQRSFRELDDVLARAERVAPDAPGVIMVRADYLATEGKLDEAVKRLRLAAEAHHSRSPDLWRRYAAALNLQGKADEAIRALERAAAPEHAGDRAAIRADRAKLLAAQGQGRAAREALVKGWQSLPKSEQPSVWKALGELLRAQGQRAAGRDALREWALLVPDDPAPGLTLLEAAVADDDEGGIRDAIGVLRGVRTTQGVSYERVARAYELLQGIRPGTSQKERQDRIERAKPLVRDFRKESKHWIGYLLQAMLDEQLGELDSAIDNYRKAQELGGGASITRRLVVLLARRKRFDELADLRRKAGSDPALDQLVAGVLLELDEKDRAEAIATEVAQGDPEGIATQRWQAAVLGRLGKPDEAEAALRALIGRRPQEPGPWLALLVFQVQQKRADAASRTIEEMTGKVKTDRPEFFLAQCYRIAEDRPRADALYQKALARWPDDDAVLRGSADYYATTGRGREAEAVLRRALRNNPEAAWAARELAMVLSSRANDYQAWQEAWSLVRPNAPGIGDAAGDRVARALVLARSPEAGRRREAVEALEGLVADLPANAVATAEARNQLARLYEEFGRSDKALADLEAAAEGGEPGAVVRYIEALIKAKKPDQAAKQLDRLVAAEPKSLRTDLVRAEVLQAKGQGADVVSVLEEAYRSRADGPEGEYAGTQATLMLLATGHPDAAERTARALARAQPKTSWILANVLARRGRPIDAIEAAGAAVAAGAATEGAEMALRVASGQVGEVRAEARDRAALVLEAARKKRPADAHLALALAQLRYFQGRFKDQVALYREAIAHDPPNFVFLNNMAYILCEELGETTEALERVEEALKKVGPTPHILDTKGVILARLGQADAAIQVLRDALRDAAPDLAPTVQFHLALAYRAAKRDDDAAKALARAKQGGLDPARLSSRERKDWEEMTKS